MASHVNGRGQTGDLTIFYNDSIDSDNPAAALALLCEVAARSSGRVLWILEPRQVALGLAMTAEEVGKCQDLIYDHFPQHREMRDKWRIGAFKVLLGGRLRQKDIDGLSGLNPEQRKLLEKAIKVPYGPLEDAKRHALLMAWDLATCLTTWSNTYYDSPAPKVEVLVDYDSLSEIQNPVNLSLHAHEEFATRQPKEIKEYNDIMEGKGRSRSVDKKELYVKKDKVTHSQKVEELRDWYKWCITTAETSEEAKNSSVRSLDIDWLCNEIRVAKSVRFMGGSSLRILRQFIDKKVADKVQCHLQVGSLDLASNLFANQFNIALNLEAAKYVFENYQKFKSFTVVPSQSAQSFKYSLVGLERVGGPSLAKKMLGFNCQDSAPIDVVTGDVTLRKNYNEKDAGMPDLTTFLCALKGKEIGATEGFVEIDYTEGDENNEGVLLFRRAEQGIPIYLLGPKQIKEEDAEKLFDFSGGGD